VAELVCLGELLIDFIAEGTIGNVGDAGSFLAAPGGAPANVAVGASRQGTRTAFLGKVGDDPFGRKLAATLAAEGVSVDGLLFDAGSRTALAFVSLDRDGERDFVFYRHPSADMLYRPEEVDTGLVESAAILHFGSISLVGEPSRGATLHAARAARRTGVLVSYDPNLRLPLWPGEREAREGMLLGWELAQVAKISEEELLFLAGSTGDDAARRLMHAEMELLVVTKGAEGAHYFTPADEGHVAGFAVGAIDTTGAGDAFVAALLSSLARERELPRMPAELREALVRANACAALTTTRHGAIPAMPLAEELEDFLAARPPRGHRLH
jgi:fructokinase